MTKKSQTSEKKEEKPCRKVCQNIEVCKIQSEEEPIEYFFSSCLEMNGLNGSVAVLPPPAAAAAAVATTTTTTTTTVISTKAADLMANAISNKINNNDISSSMDLNSGQIISELNNEDRYTEYSTGKVKVADGFISFFFCTTKDAHTNTENMREMKHRHMRAV